MNLIKHLSSHLGPIANVPVSLVFEGNKTMLIREDGSVEETEANERATAKLQVVLSEFENMDDEIVSNKINEVC